jgi:2-polyprenyl-3-methyl-5-hydroxy-6-metoxy-1,4-benzoquinol methylase
MNPWIMQTGINPTLIDAMPAESADARIRPAAPLCLACRATVQTSSVGLFDTRFGIPGEFEAQRCQRCGLEQIFPMPSPRRLKELYERYYNFGGEQNTIYTRLRQWYFSSLLHTLWASLDGDISFYLRKGKGRLLDIGCNEGRGLKIWARNGFKVEGLELNERAAAVARRLGFKVHTTPLEQFTPSEQFDVAVVANVLEHSLDPDQMLRNIHRILKPGGQIWISCPNSRSWLRSLCGRYWINWHAPFHIVHLSHSTLEAMLTRACFADIRTRQITPALWVTHSAIALMFSRSGRPTRQLRNPALVLGLMLFARLLLFPILFVGNRLGKGDCLITVATSQDSAVREKADEGVLEFTKG